MQHKINIQPTDETTTPPPSLPDRSNLSSLYTRSAAVTAEELDAANDANALFLDLRAGRVNMLLVLPAVATFLNTNYIIASRTANVADAMLPLTSFFTSAAMLLVWVACVRLLSIEFRNYNFSLLLFLGGYLFYALPLVSLVIKLSSTDWRSLSLALLAYGVVSYGLLVYVSRVISGHYSPKATALLFAVPVVVLVAANILVA